MEIVKLLLASAVTLSLTGPAVAQPSMVSVDVTVDTTKPGPEIDRHIYGQFSEQLGHGVYEGIWVGEKSKIPNIHGYRKDVVEALKKIRVPVVRWPGGCFADAYNWRDGIGPRAKRPARTNIWGNLVESNEFGTHEFLNFAELIGADAYVSGNVGSLTPHDMAQWVEYMTSDNHASLANERRKNGRDKPWQVKYFGIGNETWGCGGNMSAEYAAEINRRYSTFVDEPAEIRRLLGNAAADEGLIKVASGPSGSRPDYPEFVDAMMRDGGRLQALSLHYYTVPLGQVAGKRLTWGPATGFGEDQWAATLTKALHMDELVTKVSAIMDKSDPQKHVALFVDEWGAWYDQEPGLPPQSFFQQNSLRDAEVAALTLNIFHRHTDRVKLAAIAQMVNVLQAMILTDKDKMLLTPTYHVYDMYLPFQGATPYPATVSGPHYVIGGNDLSAVDASAARAKDGKLYLALVNLDPSRPAHVATNLSGRASGRILTGPAMDTHNTFEAPNAIHPVPFAGSSVGGRISFDLPAKSVAVVAVE